MKNKFILTGLLSIITVCLTLKTGVYYAKAEEKSTPKYVNNLYYDLGEYRCNCRKEKNPIDNYMGANFIYASQDRKLQLKHSLSLPQCHHTPINEDCVTEILIEIALPSALKNCNFDIFEDSILNLHVISLTRSYDYFHLNHYKISDYNEDIHSETNDDNHTRIGLNMSSEILTINVTIVGVYYDNYVLCGDEYRSKNQEFSFESPNCPYKLEPTKASIRVGKYSELERHTLISEIQDYFYGDYVNCNRVLYDGYIFKFDMDYDNRRLPEDIVKNIHAYDYSLEKEVEAYVTGDNLTKAINDNCLGEYSFYLEAEDKAKNHSKIQIKVNIVDKVAPTIQGENIQTISYTQLDSNSSYDIGQYYTCTDNHDVDLKLDNSTVKLNKFVNNEVEITSTDESSNVGRKIITISVIDDFDPIIKGPKSLEYYQYDNITKDDILNLYNFSDGEGSGIKEYGIKEDIDPYFVNAGDYSLTIYCTDNYNNSVEYDIDLKIKDGIGPVFFIDEINMKIDNPEIITAQDIINEAMRNNLIEYKHYTKVMFMDNNFNQEKAGQSKTRIICINEDGSKDYYQFNLDIAKQNKNVFANLVIRINSLFNTIINFFKYIWNLIMSLF